MLTIKVPEIELYDSIKCEFINIKKQTLCLEHSLVSISKWESKWCKPFLGKDKKTNEEILHYVKCMTTTQNVDEEVYKHLTDDNIKKVRDYINAPMTATTIMQPNKGSNREIVTTELIYYWMIALNIPWECQKWHLNRLFALINVCNVKNSPQKKMGKHELASRNAQLNASRRASLNTEG